MHLLVIARIRNTYIYLYKYWRLVMKNLWEVKRNFLQMMAEIKTIKLFTLVLKYHTLKVLNILYGQFMSLNTYTLNIMCLDMYTVNIENTLFIVFSTCSSSTSMSITSTERLSQNYFCLYHRTNTTVVLFAMSVLLFVEKYPRLMFG